MSKIKIFKIIFPFICLAIAFLTDIGIPDSKDQPAADWPYFIGFLILLTIIFAALLAAAIFSKKLRDLWFQKSYLYGGIVLIIVAINLIVSKFALLPVLFFPCLDRVFGVFVTDRVLMVECIFSSGRLLLKGYIIGGVLGLFIGILIGFNKRASYWINPFMKFIGPIPPTSWSPLVLSLFTTSEAAAVFMVALAVWFPITLMTSSGIQNVQQSYFEVAKTLGAKRFTNIFKVAVPAAMPSIFLGVFYATCSSFVTLVTAELLGAESGLGWYLNWQKSMMLYANVYAGLILMAIICTIIITLVFKLKDRILVWQKGVIKW